MSRSPALCLRCAQYRSTHPSECLSSGLPTPNSAMAVLGLLLSLLGLVLAQEGAITNLRTEYMHELQGLDVLSPHFSWQHAESSQRSLPSTVQDHYQVTIVDRDGSCIYNSTRIASAALIHPVPLPLPLLSNHRYTWTVTVWSAKQHTAASSWFRTGLLRQGDWQGSWIQGGTLARTSFNLSTARHGSTTTAIAFVSACQYYELYINGQRIGVRWMHACMLPCFWHPSSCCHSRVCWTLAPPPSQATAPMPPWNLIPTFFSPGPTP